MNKPVGVTGQFAWPGSVLAFIAIGYQTANIKVFS